MVGTTIGEMPREPAQTPPRPQIPPSAPPVRRASAADIPALKGSLGRAFFDDPLAEWACRPDDLRAAVLDRFYSTLLPRMLERGEVWTIGDGTSAALWRAPEEWRTTAKEDLALLRCLLHMRLLARLPLVAVGLLGVERHHPDDPPHWYLATLGTDPPAQGEGLGSKVLAPVLEQCDSDGIGAYLESSKERNLDFYARHGFRVRSELRVPRGPRIWGMWRDPRR